MPSEKHHRPNAVRDNHTFFSDILDHLRGFKDISKRVRMWLYRGIPTFGAFVADGPSWGSTMVVESFVPRPRQHFANHPRFRLKRRSNDGVYMTYWRAVEELVRESEPLVGIANLERLVEAIRRMD